MKKLIGALALAALIAGSAFAEISFGAFICDLFVPVAYNGDVIQSGGVASPWGGTRFARLDVNWTADDGKAGMSMGIFANDTGIAADTPYIWLRPVDAFKITVGALDNAAGERGDLCYGSWNWLRPSAWLYGGEGLTFSKELGDNGFEIELFPIEALHVWAAMPVNQGSMKSATTAFGNSTVGASFKIGDVAKIKAQFLGQYDATDYSDLTGATDNPTQGGWYWKKGTACYSGLASYSAAVADIKAKIADGTAKASEYNTLVATISYIAPGFITKVTDGFSYKKYGTIEAAFDLVGIDKLFVTLGGAFTIADSEWFDANLTAQKVKLALGASYGITETLKLSADFGLAIYDYLDPAFQFGVGVDFGVTEKLAVVADFRMLLPTTSGYDPTLAFLLGGTYAIGTNGSLGMGFQAIISNSEQGNLANTVTLDGGSFGFAVPIRCQIGF